VFDASCVIADATVSAVYDGFLISVAPKMIQPDRNFRLLKNVREISELGVPLREVGIEHADGAAFFVAHLPTNDVADLAVHLVVILQKVVANGSPTAVVEDLDESVSRGFSTVDVDQTNRKSRIDARRRGRIFVTIHPFHFCSVPTKALILA